MKIKSFLILLGALFALILLILNSLDPDEVKFKSSLEMRFPWMSHLLFAYKDSIHGMMNSSAEFESQFCRHRMQPVPTKPLCCVYDPKEDVYISQKIIEKSIWDQKG